MKHTNKMFFYERSANRMRNILNTLKNRKHHKKKIYVKPSLSSKTKKVSIKSKRLLSKGDFEKIADIVKDDETDFSDSILQIQLYLHTYKPVVRIKRLNPNKITIQIT